MVVLVLVAVVGTTVSLAMAYRPRRGQPAGDSSMFLFDMGVLCSGEVRTFLLEAPNPSEAAGNITTAVSCGCIEARPRSVLLAEDEDIVVELRVEASSNEGHAVHERVEVVVASRYRLTWQITGTVLPKAHTTTPAVAVVAESDGTFAAPVKVVLPLDHPPDALAVEASPRGRGLEDPTISVVSHTVEQFRHVVGAIVSGKARSGAPETSAFVDVTSVDAGGRTVRLPIELVFLPSPALIVTPARLVLEGSDGQAHGRLFFAGGEVVEDVVVSPPSAARVELRGDHCDVQWRLPGERSFTVSVVGEVSGAVDVPVVVVSLP